MWDKVHIERTNMLWSKEEYINAKHSYCQIQARIKTLEEKLEIDENGAPLRRRAASDEVIDPKVTEKFEEMELQEKMLENLRDGGVKAKQNSTAAENNYKKSVDKLNATIDQFKEKFTPLLNQIQESDFDQIEYMKLNLEKFKGIYGQIGDGFQTHSDMMNTQIDAAADLQLFIEQNRSGNEPLKKEVFQPFDDAGAISKVMNRKFNHAERIDDMSQAAVSKKQQKTKYKGRREASPEI